MKHYSPFRDRYGLWVFTSPLGKHGPFSDRDMASSALSQIIDAHAKRAQGDGAEAALLRPLFLTQQEDRA